MARLWLHLRAPFAAFRPLQAGVFRSTTRVMPPSAAYGLLLNLAGIETRQPGSQVTTGTREDLPRVQLAIGNVVKPSVATLYQQLHGYPVGNSGQELKARSRGSKYWIAPVRRELLVDFEAALGVDSEDSELLDRVQAGLAGRLAGKRYGVPFAGDNNFLFDRVDVVPTPPPAYWMQPVQLDAGPRPESVRLTTRIHRQDSSRTETVLLAPVSAPLDAPPPDAWIWTPNPPSDRSAG